MFNIRILSMIFMYKTIVHEFTYCQNCKFYLNKETTLYSVL